MIKGKDCDKNVNIGRSNIIIICGVGIIFKR